MSQQQFVEVSFREAGEIFLFDAKDLQLSANDPVIVQTEHGPALGSVKRINVVASEAPASFAIYQVMRIATQDDLRRAARHQQKEREAFEYCRQKVREYNLPMKLIRAENFFNGSKLLFYFSAEGRVDFRTLVRDLARYFQKRIEMRQIGVRDSAKLIGGIGSCGQELCCSRFLRQFHPVSIRMVKDQNLPLNQQKVSGVCGRLMCCLAYEQGLYKEMRRRLPKVGQEIETPQGQGKVREVQPLQEKVRVIFLHNNPPTEEEYLIKDLPEYRDIPVPDPTPVEFDQQKRNKRKRRRGLEPLMEPRRGSQPHDNHGSGRKPSRERHESSRKQDSSRREKRGSVKPPRSERKKQEEVEAQSSLQEAAPQTKPAQPSQSSPSPTVAHPTEGATTPSTAETKSTSEGKTVPNAEKTATPDLAQENTHDLTPKTRQGESPTLSIETTEEKTDPPALTTSREEDQHTEVSVSKKRQETEVHQGETSETNPTTNEKHSPKRRRRSRRRGRRQNNNSQSDGSPKSPPQNNNPQSGGSQSETQATSKRQTAPNSSSKEAASKQPPQQASPQGNEQGGESNNAPQKRKRRRRRRKRKKKPQEGTD